MLQFFLTINLYSFGIIDLSIKLYFSLIVKVTQSCLTLCNPGQNTGVGSLSLLQEIFPTQGSNPGFPHCMQILYQNTGVGSLIPSPRDLPNPGIKPRIPTLQADSLPEYWSGQPFPSPRDLPNPGIKPRFPALQADSLPAEPQGKPKNTRVGSLSLLQRMDLPDPGI